MSRASLGRMIREVRKSRKLPQADLAGLCGRTQSWIAKVEAGLIEPDLVSAWWIAKELELELEALVEELRREEE